MNRDNQRWTVFPIVGARLSALPIQKRDTRDGNQKQTLTCSVWRLVTTQVANNKANNQRMAVDVFMAGPDGEGAADVNSPHVRSLAHANSSYLAPGDFSGYSDGKFFFDTWQNTRVKLVLVDHEIFFCFVPNHLIEEGNCQDEPTRGTISSPFFTGPRLRCHRQSITYTQSYTITGH